MVLKRPVIQVGGVALGVAMVVVLAVAIQPMFNYAIDSFPGQR